MNRQKKIYQFFKYHRELILEGAVSLGAWLLVSIGVWYWKKRRAKKEEEKKLFQFNHLMGKLTEIERTLKLLTTM